MSEEFLQAFEREWPAAAKLHHAIPRRERLHMGQWAMQLQENRAFLADAALDGGARQSFSHWGMH